MKVSANDPMKVTTSEFRASFAHVLKKGKTPNGDEKYMVTMLFPKKTTDIKALENAMAAAIVDKFGSLDKKPKGMKNPIKDGDDASKYDPDTYKGYQGHWVVYASSNDPIQCVGPAVEEILDPKEVYSGSFGRAVIRAFAYDHSVNKGVSFGLQMYQKTRDGDPFSSRGKAEDFFDAIAGDNADNYKKNEARGLFD
jgi:hypothetical protein